jgi:hypothetical protein
MDTSADMDTSTAATVAFRLNAYKGSISVTNPIQLKEFLLAPVIHGVDTCILSISQEQVWNAFENAGFNIEHGFTSSSQLSQWLFCQYKIPANTVIPSTRINQKRVFENRYEKYY